MIVKERARAGQSKKNAWEKVFSVDDDDDVSDMTPAKCGPMRALRTVITWQA